MTRRKSLQWLSNAMVTMACGSLLTNCGMPREAPVSVIDFNPYELNMPEPTLPPVLPPPTEVRFNVFFGLNSSVLGRDAQLVIAMIADRLRADNRLRCQIRGYTDRSGTRAHNLELSKARAAAVAKALGQNGIMPDRIVVSAFGEADPQIQTRDGVREPRNRRVEIILAGRLDAANENTSANDLDQP